MAGNTSRIKWREQDKRKLQRAVKNFNAKITRVSKAHPDLAAIQPARRSAKEMEERLKQMTRADYNRTIRALQRYSSKKGSEQARVTDGGVTTSKWQLDQMRYDLAYINNRRERKQKVLNAQPGSGLVYRLADENLYKIKDNSKTANLNDFMKFSRMLEEKLFNESDPVALDRYHQNFLSAIEDQFGSSSSVYQKVAAMSDSAVFNLSWKFSEKFSFEFIYDRNVSMVEREKTVLAELERLGVV